MNEIYVTATENSSIRPLSAITYLWNVTNRETNQSKSFILQNISSALTRTDKFILVENQTENLTGGMVSLTSGHYDYFIYEQSSTSNLDVEQTGELLEQGIMMVLPQTQFGYTFDSDSTFKLN